MPRRASKSTAVPAAAGIPPGFVKLRQGHPVIEIGHRVPDRLLNLALRLLRVPFPNVCWAATAYHGVRHPEGKVGTMVGEILRSSSVRAAIADSERDAGCNPKEFKKHAASLVRGMAADLTVAAVRFLGLILSYAWGWLYGGEVYVDQEGLQRVREASAGHTLVFTPTHRSHLDYLVLSFLLFESSLPVPHIAAGDNLNLPVVGPLLRRSGAFFIRRSSSAGRRGDGRLYKALLAEYMAALVKHGHSMEFFVEGGRSRDGRVLPPRLGLLAMVVAAASRDADAAAPVCFVPLSVSYEVAVEEGSLISEMLGAKKAKESLVTLLRACARCLRRRHGRLYVSFGEPLALAPFASAQQQQQPLGLGKEEASRRLVADLGRELTGRMRLATVPTLTSLVAAALLVPTVALLRSGSWREGDDRRHGRGGAVLGDGGGGSRGKAGRLWVPRHELSEALEFVRQEVAARGGSVSANGSPGLEEDVEFAVQLLVSSGGLERCNVGGGSWMVRPMAGARARLVLQAHSNLLAHWFAPEGLVLAALRAVVLRSGPATGRAVPLREVLGEATWLRGLLEGDLASLLGELEGPSRAGEEAWAAQFDAALSRLQLGGAVVVEGDGTAGRTWVRGAGGAGGGGSEGGGGADEGHPPAGARSAMLGFAIVHPSLRSHLVAARALDAVLQGPSAAAGGVLEADAVACVQAAMIADAEGPPALMAPPPPSPGAASSSSSAATAASAPASTAAAVSSSAASAAGQVQGSCPGEAGAGAGLPSPSGGGGLLHAMASGAWGGGRDNWLVSRALPSVPLARAAIGSFERLGGLTRTPPHPDGRGAPLTPTTTTTTSSSPESGGEGGGGRRGGGFRGHPSLAGLPTVESSESLPLLLLQRPGPAGGAGGKLVGAAGGGGKPAAAADVLYPGQEYRRSGGIMLGQIAGRLQGACLLATTT